MSENWEVMKMLSGPYTALEVADFVRGTKTVSKQDQAWFEEHHIPGTQIKELLASQKILGRTKAKNMYCGYLGLYICMSDT